MSAKHLPFGGSTAHRWLLCAGSVGLNETLPPQPETEPMKRGTRAHRLLEWALNQRRQSVIDCKGKCLVAHDPVFDADDVEAVQTALDYVYSLIDAYPDAEVWIEQQVSLDDEIGGTADVIIYVPSLRILYVIDYKHGAGIYVPVVSNPQPKLYGVSAMVQLAMLFSVDIVRCVIIQPRHWRSPAIREVDYEAATLDAFIEEVNAARLAAKAPNPVFTPGELQCGDCPAAPFCAAFNNAVVDGLTFGPTWERDDVTGNVPDTYSGLTLTIPSADAIRHDPKALGDVLRAAPLIKAWLSAVEDHAEAHIRAGLDLPGYKLVEVRPRKKWVDEAGARNFLRTQTMLDETDYYPNEMITPSQAATLLKKGNGKVGDELVKQLAAFTETKSSGMKLVPESAEGDAIPVAEILAIAGGDAGDVIV